MKTTPKQNIGATVITGSKGEIDFSALLNQIVESGVSPAERFKSAIVSVRSLRGLGDKELVAKSDIDSIRIAEKVMNRATSIKRVSQRTPSIEQFETLAKAMVCEPSGCSVARLVHMSRIGHPAMKWQHFTNPVISNAETGFGKAVSEWEFLRNLGRTKKVNYKPNEHGNWFFLSITEAPDTLVSDLRSRLRYSDGTILRIRRNCPRCSKNHSVIFGTQTDAPAFFCVDCMESFESELGQCEFMRNAFVFYVPFLEDAEAWFTSKEGFINYRTTLESIIAEDESVRAGFDQIQKREVLEILISYLRFFRLFETPEGRRMQAGMEHRLLTQAKTWHPSDLLQVEHPKFDAPIERVPWQMLEADGDAWPVIYNFYGAMQKRSKTKIEMERIESIKKLKPKKIFLGLDSFRGYVAFVFPKKTVLECPKYGNAIYVFPTKHWKDLSKLSKTKLLKKHSKQIHRIRHADGVEYLLKVLLEKNP